MKKLHDKIFSYPLKNWVLWIGAGISIPNPTALPSGWSLTSFALKSTTTEKIQNKIFDVWQHANDIVSRPENITPLGIVPRLESILGEIEDIQRNSKNCEFAFLEGFKSLIDAPYNENHWYIASLLHSGATVITTNFDTCIQKAYIDFSKNTDRLIPKKKGNTWYYVSEKYSEPGILWHIHGVADEIHGLGATIRVLKEGLNPKFQEFLDAKLSESSVLIFLGYSAGDSFDVNLHFSNKMLREFKNSLAVFIQHGNSKIPENAYRIVKCFGKTVLENADTTILLKRLSPQKLHRISRHKSFSWENLFIQHTNLINQNELRDILICKISNMLGISIDILDASSYQNALRYEKYFDYIDFHKTLATVCRMQGNSLQEKQHDIISKSSDIDMLGYYYSQGDLKKALKYAKEIDDIFEDARNSNAELGWRTYTSMSVHCRIKIMHHLKLKSVGIKTFRKKQNFIRLIELTDLLGNRPLLNVTYINQVATALRFNVILKAILSGENDQETEERILYLYGEASSVVGYVSAYRDLSLKYFFLAKFWKNQEYLNNSLSYGEKSLKLAELIGDLWGQKRAKYLLTLLRINRVFNK